MLFISYARTPSPRKPGLKRQKLPFGAIRQVRRAPLTRDERRAFLSHHIFGRLIRRRIFGIADAHFMSLMQEFDKTKKGARLDRRLTRMANWSKKMFGQRKVSICNPDALDAKTRQLLSKRKVKRGIINYYSGEVQYYKALLEFAEERKGVFQNCITIINEKIGIAEKDLTRIKTSLEQY